jgi:hypothetical protein
MSAADSNLSDMIIHMHKSTVVHDLKGHREWNDMILFFFSSDYISILHFVFVQWYTNVFSTYSAWSELRLTWSTHSIIAIRFKPIDKLRVTPLESMEFPEMTSRSVSPSVSSSMRFYRACFVSDAVYDGSLKLQWSICVRSNQPARNRDSESHIPELSHERVNRRHCRSVQPIQRRVFDLSAPRVTYIRMNVIQVNVYKCKKILLV